MKQCCDHTRDTTAKADIRLGSSREPHHRPLLLAAAAATLRSLRRRLCQRRAAWLPETQESEVTPPEAQLLWADPRQVEPLEAKPLHFVFYSHCRERVSERDKRE